MTLNYRDTAPAYARQKSLRDRQSPPKRLLSCWRHRWWRGDFVARAQPVRELRRRERVARRVLLEVQDHRPTNVGKELHFEELLAAARELEHRDGPAAAQVDHVHAA